MGFNSVVGHDRQKELFGSLLSKERLPHALMLVGPKGVGKCTMAMELTRILFCDTKAACGTCRPCRNLNARIHPDFTFVAGDTSIKIDQLRGIRKEVYEPPYEAPVRVILIDNADLMTREAANALLKTLEEPPPSNLFILVTSREQEILATIRSRCMRVGFGPLRTDVIHAYFRDYLKVDPARAQLLATISSGSIASGVFWMDEENLQLRRRIAEAVVSGNRNLTNASLLAERITKSGSEAQYLSFLLSFFRDIWWLDHEGDVSGLVNTDLRQVIEESATARQGWVETSIEMIQTTLRSLRYALNKWLAVEDLMLGLVRHA